jgi:GTP-dependent phosphoenolpyruvate carboxykinase
MNEILEKISAQSVLSGTGKIDLARMARITGWRVTSLGKRISWKKKANQNFAMALELLAENGLLPELEHRIWEKRND